MNGHIWSNLWKYYTHVYAYMYVNIFVKKLKDIKYEFRKASCGGDVMRKRTHARWFDYGARTGHDIRPWRGMTKNVRVIYWCVFLYCCLQHINETTIFLISILLWWHFFMMYVFVYISFLILNKVFFLIAEWATICDILWLMEL